MNSEDKPLISVVVPVYNVEHYLDECLNSIKNQTYKRLEIIVVEDCSTDRSLHVLQPHLQDSRTKLIQHSENSGLSAARNTGINAATGDYLLFVDSDDVVDERLVEVCVKCARQYKSDVLTYSCIPFDDGKTPKDIVMDVDQAVNECRRSADDYFGLPHFAWLKFVRTGLLKSDCIRFPIGLYYEDWPFHWGLGLAAKKIFNIEAGLYHYRQRKTSITGSTGEKLLDLFKVHALVFEMIDNEASDMIRRRFSNKLYDSYWSILTRIDDRLLAFAHGQAKAAYNVFLFRKDYAPEYKPRRRVIAWLIHLPEGWGLMALRMLRRILITISIARRQVH